jgi:hypothetical protein
LSETALADRQDGRPAGRARLVLLILKALAEAVHAVSVRTILWTHRILARICEGSSWPRQVVGKRRSRASSHHSDGRRAAPTRHRTHSAKVTFAVLSSVSLVASTRVSRPRWQRTLAYRTLDAFPRCLHSVFQAENGHLESDVYRNIRGSCWDRYWRF